MSVTLETSETGSRIALEGAIDIAAAGDLKAALLAAIEAGRPVEVALEQTSYLDVTAMQLLWAAGRAAQRAGVKLEPEGRLPEPVQKVLAEAGIQLFAAE